MTRPRGDTRLAPLGLAAVIATAVALDVVDDVHGIPVAALAGLVLLGLAGLLTTDRSSLVLAVACALPGAALVGFGGELPGPAWLAIAVTLTAAIGGPLAADADRRWGRVGAAPVGFGVSAIGLYACVPDTEEAKVLLGVALVAAAVSRLPWLRVFGAVGATAAVGVFAWVAAFDARGRPAAFVGAAGALALLALEPIGVWLRGGRRRRVHGRGAVVVVLASQIGLAAYAARVPGLEQSVGHAVVLLAPALVLGVCIGIVAGAPTVDRSAPATQSSSTSPIESAH